MFKLAAQSALVKLRIEVQLALVLGAVLALGSGLAGFAGGLSRELEYVGERAGSIVEANVAPVLARGNLLEVEPRLQSLLAASGLGLRYVRVIDRDGRIAGAAGYWTAGTGSSFKSTVLGKLQGVFASGRARSLIHEGMHVGHIRYGISYWIGFSNPQGDGYGWLVASLLSGALGIFLLITLLPVLRVSLARARGGASRPGLLERFEAAAPELPAVAGDVWSTQVAAALVSALNSLDQGLVLTDMKGRVRYMNIAAESLLGWRLKDALDKPVYAVIHALDEAREPIASPTERCVSGEISRGAMEVWLRPRSGASLPVNLRAANVFLDGAEAIGTITAIEDLRSRYSEKAALEARATVWETAVDGLDQGLLWVSSAGLVENLNGPAACLLGFAREELIGQSIAACFPIPFRSDAGATLDDYRIEAQSLPRKEVIGSRQNGSAFPADFRVCVLEYHGSHRYLVMFRDLTAPRRQESLRARIGRILDLTADEVYVFDALGLRIQDASEGACRSLGYSLEELRQMSYTRICNEIDLKQFERHLSALSSGRRGRISLRTLHTRKDGSVYPVDLRLSLAPEESSPTLVALAQDVSEQQQSEARLHFLAHHDPLTGLPNRALLMDRLQQAIFGAERSKRLFALIFVDLDRFKEINDTLGHEVGDVFLKGVAERLRRSVRSEDTVARLSGDEFTLIMGGLSDRESAVGMVEHLLAQLDQPVEAGGRQLRISASLGVTLYPLDRSRPDELLQHADMAMYEAKQEGGRRYRFFEQSLNSELHQRAAQQALLRTAIEQGQLEMEFQPVFAADSGRLTYAEVISIWDRAGQEDLRGAALLERIAQFRLQAVYDTWLFQTVTAQLVSWREIQVPAVPLILSPGVHRARREGSVDELVAALGRSGVDPGMLVLDLSHSGLLEDAGNGIPPLRRLTELGVGLCASEASPGATDIARLAQAPLTLLRLSPACVAQLPASSEAAKFVQAVLSAGRALSMPVLGQGIATAGQQEFLRQAGCTLLQGEFLSKPLRAIEFVAKLAAAPRTNG